MRHHRPIAALLLCMALACWGCTAKQPGTQQAAGQPTPAPTAATPTAAVPAQQVTQAAPPPAQASSLSMSVYRRTAQGAQVRVPSTYPFRSGDSVRIGVLPSESGFLYLLTKGTSGASRLMYPDRRIANGQNTVTGGQEIVIPSEGWFTFDRTPGTETIYALFSKERDQVLFGNVERATGFSGNVPDASVEAQVLEQFQARSRDMHLSGPGGGQPTSAGTGAPPAGDGGGEAAPVLVSGAGSVVAELKLNHE